MLFFEVNVIFPNKTIITSNKSEEMHTWILFKWEK